jgi:uncharacterized coiled-coil DUF342 family protein
MAPKADAKSKSKPKKEPKEVKKEEEETGRVEEPDRKEYENQRQAIQNKINDVQKELKDLSKQIGDKSHGKDEFQSQKNTLLASLREQGEAISKLKEAKDAIRNSLNASNQEAKDAKRDLSRMQNQMKYQNVTEIDEAIAELEAKQRHESMTLQQEKKLLEQIKQLKKDKSKVKDLAVNVALKEREVGNMADNDSSATMKEKLDTIKREMDAHFQEKQKISDQLDELKKQREEKTGDVKDLYEKRDELNKKSAELKKEQDALWQDFNDRNQAFKTYMREVRAQRQMKRDQEREAWDKQKEQERRQREVEKLDEMPHQHEMTLIEQTIKFCKSFQPKQDTAQEEKKETTYDNPDTHVVLKSKGDREEEYFFAPTKAKQKKGKKASEGASTKSIKHNAETFKLFSELKLDTPVTTDDIPKTLEKLEAELEKYKELVKKWEEEREELKRKILEEGVSAEEKAGEEKEA